MCREMRLASIGDVPRFAPRARQFAPGGNPGIMDGSDEGLQSALFTAWTAFEAFTTALAICVILSA